MSMGLGLEKLGYPFADIYDAVGSLTCVNSRQKKKNVSSAQLFAVDASTSGPCFS
jgi:hypothetical protein